MQIRSNFFRHKETLLWCGGIMSHKLLCRIEKNLNNVENGEIGIVSQFLNVEIFTVFTCINIFKIIHLKKGCIK